MAVYYKGKKMPWLIPGMKSTEDINLDPVTFDPRMLPQRRIVMSSDMAMIRIPDVPNRVRIRKDGYVELILETHYDRETKQSRNKKVIIGTDQSGFLPGMMTPNENYHNLFDGRGRLYNDPMKQPKPTETEPPETQKAQTTKTPGTADKELKATQEPKATKEPKETKEPKATQEPKTTINQPGPEGKPTDNTKEQELKRRAQELTNREAELKRREQELDEWQQRLEEKEEDLYFQSEETAKDHIKLLSYILESYKDTVDHQARKKPDAPMTRKQIRTINQILGELKDFFTGCETDDLLHLAEEPDPENDNPGTTNGEMALLISAYQFTINAFRLDELRNK